MRIGLLLLVLYGSISCTTGPERIPDSTIDAPEVPTSISPVTEVYEQDRAIWQQPDLVLSSFGDLTGQRVADIGAGAGYFAFRLLPRVDQLIAIDIDPKALHLMDSLSALIPEDYRDRLTLRLAEPQDPKLDDQEVDAVLMVNTYMFIADRINYLKTLRAVLPETGRLLIVDFKKKKLPLGPPAEERVALSILEDELEQAGFRILRSDDQSLSYQYIVLAIAR